MSKIEITSKVSLTLPSRINPGMRGTIALSSRLKTKPTSSPTSSKTLTPGQNEPIAPTGTTNNHPPPTPLRPNRPQTAIIDHAQNETPQQDKPRKAWPAYAQPPTLDTAHKPSHPLTAPKTISQLPQAPKTISQLPISQICIPKPHARPCQTNHSRIGIETERHLKENKVHLNKSGTIEFAKNISNSYCSRIDIALIIVQWR